MPYLDVLGSDFDKLLSYLKLARPRIILTAKYPAKTKIPKFRTKNTLPGCFLGWNFKKLLSYLKTLPSNFSNKFSF